MNQRHNPLGQRNRRSTSTAPAEVSDCLPCEGAGGSLFEDHQDTTTGLVGQREAAIRVRQGTGQELPEGQAAFSDVPEQDSTVDEEALAGSITTSWLHGLNGLIICLVVIVAAAFLLVTITQTAVLIREINSWIQPAWAIGWLSLLAIWMAVAAASFQLASVFIRYRQSPSVSLSALKQFREREAGRMLSARSNKGAADKVRQFLQEYPDGSTQRAFLRSVMGSTESVTTLLDHRRRLLDNRYGVSTQWLQQVHKQFTCALDAAADQIVKRYSYRVGVGTAVSPRGAIDSMIVLVSLQRMTTELCHLYGVRPGRMESLIILGHVVVAATLAAGSDQAGEMVGDQVEEVVRDSLGALGAGLVGQLSGRVAEGTVNSLFVRRIGYRLRGYLRPTRD